MNEPKLIAGNQYSIGRVPARKQLHIARRLAPVLQALAFSAAKEMSTKDSSELIGPISEMAAKMTDADVDFVIDTCLAVCKRKGDAGYFPVMSSNGVLMFDDITMPVMLQLAFAVVQENMADFFPQAASGSKEAAPTQ